MAASSTAGAPTSWAQRAPFDTLNWLALCWDSWLAGRSGLDSVLARRENRLRQMVAWARAHSPFYRERYRGLRPEAGGLAALPPVTRHELMAQFDRWVTDPAITREAVRAFVADRSRVGQPFLGRYAAWTSSGTTGEPGLYLQDAEALAVYDALQSVRFGATALRPNFLLDLLARGGRFAMVAATGGHFAGVASIERLRQLNPLMASRMRVVSILQPISALVQELNALQPGCIATYPTAAAVLAHEQADGRLAISPAAVWTGGEWLSGGTRQHVQTVFGCPVVDDYGASECMSIASDCGHGWLHLNADWVVLEPVDRDYRPVAAGTPSHTVLLTNLANKVQPIIRYDLGDSVTFKPGACECGSALPALRVEGRQDDLLAFPARDGTTVRLLPLALTTVLEEEAEVFEFQLVQSAPERLAVRLIEGERAAWSRVYEALRAYLGQQGLRGVEPVLDTEPPARSPISGKVRRMVRAL
jgi:phenylacetate-coenzyme A ligase PaaK-like adenylate-forming protein